MAPRPIQLLGLFVVAVLLIATPSSAQDSGATAARHAVGNQGRIASGCAPADRAADDSDDNIVWGTGVVWCGTDQSADDDNIIWGTGIAGGDDNIVWGTAAGRDDDNIVWGTGIASPDGDEAGDSNLSFDDNIVWGT